MNKNPITEQDPYLAAFRGSFTSALRWHHLDALWESLKAAADDQWFIYAIGHQPPREPAPRDKLLHFIDEIDALLRREHDEDYCGIVYADDLKRPAFIKIYDPHNLGVSCGYSDNPPLPGWVLSRIPPCDPQQAAAPTASRKRWWEKIFG